MLVIRIFRWILRTTSRIYSTSLKYIVNFLVTRMEPRIYFNLVEFARNFLPTRTTLASDSNLPWIFHWRDAWSQLEFTRSHREFFTDTNDIQNLVESTTNFPLIRTKFPRNEFSTSAWNLFELSRISQRYDWGLPFTWICNEFTINFPSIRATVWNVANFAINFPLKLGIYSNS